MKRIKFYTTGLLSIILCCLLNGCKSEENSIDGTKVSAIVLKEGKFVGDEMQLTLKDNQALQLTPVILPESAINQSVTYSNENQAILEVSNTGLITAKGIGRDVLTVSATDGSGVSTSYIVVVADHRVKATSIEITEAGSNIALKNGGKTFNLAAEVTVLPDDTEIKTVTYESSDNSVAEVSALGIVTSIGIGTAVITIRTTDGTNLSNTCNVTVSEEVRTEVDLNRSGWTVSTSVSYGYVVDGTTGKPEDMFDDNAATFLSLVKPGKTYSGISGTSPIHFEVDMDSAQKFNYLVWKHRAHAYPYLRVWGVDVYGSDDNSEWTKLNTETVLIPGTEGVSDGVDQNTYRIYIDNVDKTEYTYRYVKIDITKWSDNSGGSTSGSTVQTAEFGLGLLVVE